jgi:hypothetical protein
MIPLELPFSPVSTYNAVDIFKILRDFNLNCTMVDRAKTNTHWHFYAALFESSNRPSVYVFLECRNWTVLYIATEGSTAMFRRFDSMAHACDEQPTLRSLMEQAQAAEEKAKECWEQEQEDDDDNADEPDE